MGCSTSDSSSRAIATALLGLALLSSGCARARHPVPPAPPAAPRLELSSGELEEIRWAAIRYCEAVGSDDGPRFVALLARGAVWIDDGAGPAIGVWRVETAPDGGIDLLWRPSLALFHTIHVVRRDGTWTAVSHATGEELVPPF